MEEINNAWWTPMDMCTHSERPMKIKQQQLHDDSFTHNNVAIFGHSNEGLTTAT